jgi:hypothetical protein
MAPGKRDPSRRHGAMFDVGCFPPKTLPPVE